MTFTVNELLTCFTNCDAGPGEIVEAKLDKGRKRTREGSSQTDEEDESDQHHKHGCKKCLETTNSMLSGIEEKLNMLLTVLPELETYKKRITLLEEENKTLQTSLIRKQR